MAIVALPQSVKIVKTVHEACPKELCFRLKDTLCIKELFWVELYYAVAVASCFVFQMLENANVQVIL